MGKSKFKGAHLRMIALRGEEIKIRRYDGIGRDSVSIDVDVRARVVGYEPNDIVGTIQQGDRRLIVLAEDLASGAFSDGVRPGDKAVVRGRELNIEAVDDNTRRVAGVLIAYELQVRG